MSWFTVFDNIENYEEEKKEFPQIYPGDLVCSRYSVLCSEPQIVGLVVCYIKSSGPDDADNCSVIWSNGKFDFKVHKHWLKRV